MSDESETKFEKWNTAYNEHEKRKSFYVQISAKYPPDHEFVKLARPNWTRPSPNTKGL